MRHTAKPGLSGLAQVNGRNAIKWEDKLNWDLKYIENVTLLKDFSIILKTVKTAFIKQEGITDGDMATAEDFGDYLLENEKITSEEYDKKQIEPAGRHIIWPRLAAEMYICTCIQGIFDKRGG